MIVYQHVYFKLGESFYQTKTCKERRIKMTIVTLIEYWPAKYLGSEEEKACFEHEFKLYGPGEVQHKEWGIERLAICGKWEGNNARIMAVLKIPSEHLVDWTKDLSKRNSIYVQKLDGFDSEYEIWASNEEMDEMFKDEPFYKERMNSYKTLVEKYSKKE